MLFKGFLTLLAPVAQYAFLRLFLREVVHLRIGWSLFVDWDLFVSVPCAYFVVFYCLDSAKKVSLSFSLKRSLVNLAFLAGVISYSFLIRNPEQSYSVVSLVAWWGLVLASLVTAFFVLVPPAFFISNPKRVVLIPGFLIAFSVVIQNYFVKMIWESVGPRMMNLSCWSLKGMMGSEMQCEFYHAKYLVLHHPLITAFIGEGCAGFDGLMLFLSLFLLFYANDKKYFSKSQWLFYTLFGVMMMYIVNIFRIVSLFLIGASVSYVWGKYWGMRVMIQVFHLHMGWVLYALAISAYFKLVTHRKPLTLSLSEPEMLPS